MTTLHVLPVDDLIDHTDSEDCICGPTIESIQHDDGTIDWVITHHSLDGRETHENDEAEAPRRDWWARWRPAIELIFVLASTWLSGAILHPSSDVTDWIFTVVLAAYLAWTITSYIHTRRTR
ncbi:hypothetical protein DUY81_13975 [Acidipropionibacterium acidipropionici]|uniref:Uncharacterized protein n=1 Tax=Acidipropionibacterium acidipropionici TaxID=1748 RepID=A0AAC9AP23_9ACTN|nr:hypothetical protein [Acidipropionibacterium acidipropionici]AMS06462.1 hypothetical protein AXH35_14390 [Acidipropionibacterium acidipropionici]AOZ47909.1 hypothetical protein A8L58_15845 [Acidipropionibacterium acidipropionici]AZP38745.1 hypothetical protein DUY81_13975 [Acidipropionibacterium acidipropionici]